jgi:hypothetical protein
LTRLPPPLSNLLVAGNSMWVNRHEVIINDRLLTFGDNDKLKLERLSRN